MPDLSRILAAKAPLTLASVARRSQPLVLADLARAAAMKGARAVFIAPTMPPCAPSWTMRRVLRARTDVIDFPAWDCLPYDRSSPAVSISTRRLAALHQLQQKADGRTCWSPRSTRCCSARSPRSASANRCACSNPVWKSGAKA
jgi:transcription-repair coupling factor (superfamily II helicase)